MTYLQELGIEARRTIKLAAPIIIGQVGQHVLHLIDAIMIGQVGRVPLAASAFAGVLVSLMMLVGIGLLASVSVLAARARGPERGGGATGEILRHGALMGLGLGLVTGLAASAGVFFLRHFGQPPEVELVGRAYFVILGWSAVPALVFHALKQYCEGRSAPTPPMTIMLVTVLLNIALNWVLIFGHLGAPALGLAGAGWATLLARTFGMVMLFWFIFTRPRFASERPGAWLAPFQRAIFADIFRVGFPISMQLLFEAGLFTAAAILMGWLGTVQLAAHQIALSCIALIFMVPLGMSIAVGIRISQACGEGDSRRVRVIGHGAIGSTLVFMGMSAVLLLLGGEWIATAFVDDVVKEAPVVKLAGRLFVIAALFQVVDGLQVVVMGALRGLLDVRVPTAITFVAYWVMALPLAYIGGFGMGFDALGVWSGLAAGLLVSAVALTFRFERHSRGLTAANSD